MGCNQHQTPLPPSSCCSCSCPSSPSALSDWLLQAMASGGFLSSPTPQCADGLLSHHRTLEQQRRYGKQQRFHHQEAHYSAISFLINRIEAMESSLRKLHSSSSSSSFRCPAGSVRDAAARTIQFRFRAFLVRRSQTLRQLKDLALVESRFSSLKSSFFNEDRVDFGPLSQKIMDLILILLTVVGSDPMITDSKRSIRRDLIQFLELINRKREELFSKAKRNSRFNENICKSKVMGSKRGKWGGGRKEMYKSRIENSSDEEDEEHCRNIIEHDNQIRGILRHMIKPQSEVKRNVRFAESEYLSIGNSSRNQPVPNADERSLDKSDCSDDDVQLVENLCNEVEQIKGVSSLKSVVDNDNEERDTINSGRNTARNVTNGGNHKIRAQNRVPSEGFVFSAPLPEKMEDKADLVKKRKALKR